MTERLQFWQRYLRTLSDTDLCAVKARGLRRADLCALLEVITERSADSMALGRRCRALSDIWHRKWSPFCVDCGIDVHLINEYYMVRSAVWNNAWIGRRRPSIYDGQLCIGCLECRLGRTLMAHDFTDAPVNVKRYDRSDRLRDRLVTQEVANVPKRALRGGSHA